MVFSTSQQTPKDSDSGGTAGRRPAAARFKDVDKQYLVLSYTLVVHCCELFHLRVQLARTWRPPFLNPNKADVLDPPQFLRLLIALSLGLKAP